MDLNDIMVIDGDKFYFCNYNKLYNITHHKTILITDFYDPDNLFLPPEFIHNNTIPFSTHYTSVYYSLAIVILFCLANSNTRPNSRVYHNCKENLLKEQQLAVGRHGRQQHTKLYNTLTQCMIEDPIGRKLFLF
jgi:hypothetical protein